MVGNSKVVPFVKWVGGKRQLLKYISAYLPQDFNRYYEPFVGGGALLFYLQPSRAIINDYNEELINLYNVIKDSAEVLIESLKRHKNDREYYYRLRSLDRERQGYQALTEVERASRILFLNKTCYNGLYRVNSRSEFNSPFGSYAKPNIVNEVTIRAVSDYLSSNEIEIYQGDYELSLSGISRGSFVYFDPPYDRLSSGSSFTGYTCVGFDQDEQRRLKFLCDSLDRKGVKFLLSNSSTDFIRDLYKGYEILKIGANRVINSRGDSRGVVEEVLIRNYD